MNEEKGINEYNKKVIDDLNKKINQQDKELIKLKEDFIDMKNK